jgi:hypothetical protein
VRPEDLAAELGINGRTLRGWLRLTYPRGASERGSSWDLTAAQVAAARSRWSGRSARSAGLAAASVSRPITLAGDGGRDWFWEGNVQDALVRRLKRNGWKIEWTSDPATKEQGDDIRASKDGRTLRVEVKGWPTKGRYSDPARATEVKRTQPSTQAGHWYSQAVLRVLRDLGRHRGDLVAIGLPDWLRFRHLVDDTELALKRLGVAVWFVNEKGEVEVRLGHPKTG